jgi:hypothetical protein
MAKAPSWQPDNTEALEKLIRTALKDPGNIRPDDLPSHIRAHLRDYASGETDIDDYVAKVLKKIREEQ